MSSLREIIRDLPRGETIRLAEKAGVTRATLNNAKRGTVCGEGAARRIAHALGCPDRWPELRVLPRTVLAVHNSLAA